MNLESFIEELTETLKSGNEEDILELMYFSENTFEEFNKLGKSNFLKELAVLPFKIYKNKDVKVTISEVELSQHDKERFLNKLSDKVQLECTANLTYQKEGTNFAASVPIVKVGDTYKIVVF